MKTLLSACCAGLLLATSPAWADDDDRRGKRWNKHAEKQWKNEQKYWAKQERQRRQARHFREEVVVQHYYPAPRVSQHYYTYVPRPVPVYSPPPGVHVVMPNVYIPF